MRIRFSGRRLLAKAAVVAAVTAAVVAATPSASMAGSAVNGNCTGTTASDSYYMVGVGTTECTTVHYRVRAVAYWEMWRNGAWVIQRTGNVMDVYNGKKATSVVYPPLCSGGGQWRIRTRHVRQVSSTSTVYRWDTTSPTMPRYC